jgi:hypothetical protein
MRQETGETRDAIIEDDNKLIQQIVSANQNRRDIYWIVLFAKASKNSIEGKPVLVKHIKAYSKKPSSQMGMVVGTVDNSKGTVEWELNMPQVPFDFDLLPGIGAASHNERVIETSTIPHAYLTQ